jgi:hypothetical protein
MKPKKRILLVVGILFILASIVGILLSFNHRVDKINRPTYFTETQVAQNRGFFGLGVIGVLLIFARLLLIPQNNDGVKLESVTFTINKEYSYARDRLNSHISMPTGPEKTMEILDDVVRVISEYIIGQDRKIAAWDFGELTQHLSNTINQGLVSVMKINRETKMMRPILAGLKKLVLIDDCEVNEQEIPDDVDKILKMKGPREVDEVIQYLISVGLV